MEEQEFEQEAAEKSAEASKKRSTSLKKMVIHLAIMLGIGLIITLGFFYLYLPGKTNHGETITVPDLVEVNMEDLEEILIQRGLRFEVNDSVYSSKYPPLTIVQQYPAAGAKVKEGRKIFLSVNRKSVPTVSFPDDLFNGEKSLTHVKAVLNNLDISIERTLVRRGKFFNLVLEVRYEGEPIQNGDKIPKGSSVVVVVADGYGVKSFELPSFLFKPFDEVDAIIKGSDLNLEPLNIKSGIDTTGQVVYVVKQSPDPKTVVNIGENITLWLDIKMDSTYYFELYPDTTRVDTIITPADVISDDSDSTQVEPQEH